MAIEVNNAVFYYPDGTLVIDDLSFRVPTGSVTALVGPNGVGKTTMLGIIAGDLTLDERVEVAVPPMTGAVCIATGGINVANAVRTVATVEATWMERVALLGPPYRGTLTPLIQSQILLIARRLLDRHRDRRESGRGNPTIQTCGPRRPLPVDGLARPMHTTAVGRLSHLRTPFVCRVFRRIVDGPGNPLLCD